MIFPPLVTIGSFVSDPIQTAVEIDGVYPTLQAEEVRQTAEDLLSDDVVVAWGADGGGDLAVVVRDGTLGWWQLEGGEIEPVEGDWDPSDETRERVEAGDPL